MMRFILYTKIGADEVKGSLGLPEYSYYFVYKAMKPVFERLGRVFTVGSEEEIHTAYTALQNDNEECLIVCFCPPNVAPDTYPAKALCVLAWEFDTIPNETWDEDPRNDWLYVLQRHVGVVCLSSFTSDVVKQYVDSTFPVVHIPVPVLKIGTLASKDNDFPEEPYPFEIQFQGNLIDNRNLEITTSDFRMLDYCKNFALTKWNGRNVSFDFNQSTNDSAYLGGCYQAENFGTWSRLEKPWLFLKFQLKGRFELHMRVRGYGNSIGNKINVSIGPLSQEFVLLEQPTTYNLKFDSLDSPHNVMHFSGLDLSPVRNALDPRSMAIGFEKLDIAGLEGQEYYEQIESVDTISNIIISPGSVVYTTVLNPVDARKNWPDIVTSFCWAFKEVEDAVLLLKVTHHDLSSVMGRLHFLLQQIGPVRCRVAAIHGYLSDQDYERLIEITDFYVNASTGEGLCIPLLEFMASGKPAIAPNHTSMRDYLSPEASFLLEFARDIAIWPQDPRHYKRATLNRVDWMSLVSRFQESFSCRRNNPDEYLKRSNLSSLAIREYANTEIVCTKLEEFLEAVFAAPCNS